jgi:hypothetical protein
VSVASPGLGLSDAVYVPSTKSSDPTNPLATQVGGGHYKKMAIQPVEYVHANGIGYFEGNVIKYVSRWRDKNGIDDLKKARHYLDLLIELETRNVERT